MSTLSIRPPRDFWLPRDACSYGYIILAPNFWDVRAQALWRALLLPAGPAAVRITQKKPGGALSVRATRTLDAPDRAALRADIARMLRLDEDEAHVARFHDLDPRWRASGRARLFRSPSMFEDVVKTVTSCNVAWPNTVRMNARLCAVYGKPVLPPKSPEFLRVPAQARFTFPAPATLSRARPPSLRARCRVGYRDQRIVDLARLFAHGRAAPAWFEDPATPDDAVHQALIDLPGIGPYAAANIMQLLGRYARLPLDTESVRHGRAVLGMKGASAAIMKRLHRHYAPMGNQAFRSYWFELWEWYERTRGPSHLWDADEVGSSFTAAQF